LNAAREKARLELFYELAEKFPIELPSSIIDSEVKARFQSLKTIADKSQGAIPFDTTKENEIKAEILADTRNFFTVMFLLRPLASQLKLDVTQNELMQELTYETTFLPPQLRIVYPGVDPQEARSRLIMRITMRKCLDVILMMKAQQQAPDSENA
jgi:FKBP-type peptidyl-prolyl cis-trans isomerase (trigger factor)